MVAVKNVCRNTVGKQYRSLRCEYEYLAQDLRRTEPIECAQKLIIESLTVAFGQGFDRRFDFA